MDFKQVLSSGAAMVIALQKANNKNKPIVIIGWKSYLMWADYNLKYLEDTKDVCAIVLRQGFAEDYPKLEKFFSNFNLDETELYDLMATKVFSSLPKTLVYLI